MMHPAAFWQKIANVARKLKGPWPLAPTAKAQSSFLVTVRPPISCTKDLHLQISVPSKKTAKIGTSRKQVGREKPRLHRPNRQSDKLAQKQNCFELSQPEITSRRSTRWIGCDVGGRRVKSTPQKRLHFSPHDNHQKQCEINRGVQERGNHARLDDRP